MEKEQILAKLSDYAEKPSEEIPEELEDYLKKIANTGETWFPWSKVKPLFIHKLNMVMDDWCNRNPESDTSPLPNVDNVTFEVMKKRVLDAIELFTGAPFTIQRLCELITNPQEHYKSTDKFMRGLEKNLNVVSTVDPYGNKIVSESKMLVNGMDSNGFEVEKVSASAPELSEYLGTEGAANNITQLTPTDRNTTGTQPGTSTSNTWFPGDMENASWEQRQAAVSTNGTDDETTEQLVNHTADETTNEKTEQTTNEKTEQTANQDTEERANQSSDSEEGKADSSSSASDNADDNKEAKSAQDNADAPTPSDSNSKEKSLEPPSPSAQKEDEPETSTQQSSPSSQPSGTPSGTPSGSTSKVEEPSGSEAVVATDQSSDKSVGTESSEAESSSVSETMDEEQSDVVKQTEEVDQVQSSDDKTSTDGATNSTGEKVKRRGSDNDDSEAPLRKRGRLEEGVDSTEGVAKAEGVVEAKSQHGVDSTEGVAEVKDTGSDDEGSSEQGSADSSEKAETGGPVLHNNSLGFEPSMEASSSTSQDSNAAEQPMITDQSEDSDSCSSISSSTEKADVKSDEAANQENDCASSTSGQNNENTDKKISKCDGIQDSHVTTADQSNAGDLTLTAAGSAPVVVGQQDMKFSGSEADASSSTETDPEGVPEKQPTPAEAPSQSTDSI